MPHAEGRTIHDSDSHIIEGRGWLESYCTDYVKENLSGGVFSLDLPQLDPFIEMADRRLAGEDPELTQALKDNIFGHKVKMHQWAAFGAIDKAERSESLLKISNDVIDVLDTHVQAHQAWSDTTR